MPAEIHKQVLDYQGGDANAALELVEKFKPLIKRYAFFLHREDSFEDLQRFLLSMLKTWDTSRLSSTDDATVTRYIANSVKNEYIALSKQKAKERGTSYLEDATLPQALEYAQKTSTCDQYDQLTLQDLSRYGVTYILKKYAAKASPVLEPQNISPHVLRHTKAMHLLRAGVNMIYIRDFLGHADISTTEVYARIDAEMKRKVFEEKVPNYTPNTTMPWEEDEDLLQWLTQFGKKTF